MRKLILMLTALLWFTAAAYENDINADSVYVYNSWEAIFDQWPDTLLVNAGVSTDGAFDFEISTDDKEVNKMLKKESVALMLTDGTWLINSEWLKENFDANKKMSHYIPLYFSSKIAFVQWAPAHPNVGVSILGGLLGDPDLFAPETGKLYLLNFATANLDKLTPELLSELLSDYRDLQMRYEGMHDYREDYIISDFFLQYVQRITNDPNVPDLF